MARPNLALVTDRPLPRLRIAQEYQVHYHPGEPNHCPGCGRDQWLVGRVTAECAFCATALAIAHPAVGAGA